MSWFICNISPKEPGNWDLCKQVGLWGVPGGRGLGAARRPKQGDHFLFWLGGRGYVGYGLVTGEPRTPHDRAEAPWPGGKYRFSLVIPFKLQLEADKPYRLAFVNGRQEVTGLSSASLQLGLARIPDEMAARVTAVLLDRELNREDTKLPVTRAPLD
jgi:hypothetical protein